MNILYIADINPKTHDLKWIFNFSESIEFNTYLICLDHQLLKVSNDHLTYLDSKGINILGSIPVFSTIRFYRTWQSALKIKDWLKGNNIQLIHIMYAEPNALWALFRNYFGIPIVLTTRGTDVLKTIPEFFQRKDPLSFLVRKQYQNAFRSMDIITCTSLSQKKSIISMAGSHKIDIVRTGVDMRIVNQANDDIKKKLGLKRDIILMPRTMLPLYNHEFTLDAISILSPSLRNNYTFLFVNSDTPDRVYFEFICNKSKSIDADIRFVPSFSQTEIISLYKQALLVIMNPISDGSPVSAMEAMATKVPVILPPLNYDSEIFKDNTIGFTEWDPNSLAETMCFALNMSDKSRKKLTKRAFDTIEKNYSTKEQMNKIRQIYKRLITNA